MCRMIRPIVIRQIEQNNHYRRIEQTSRMGQLLPTK